MGSSREYLPRVVDTEVVDRLQRIGAVVLEGPKGCGKTETGGRHAASEVRLDVDAAARVTAEIAPQGVLDGPVPRLIDEWQVVPRLWNDIRRAVDERREPGQFIVTGSATPADDATRHTGAGRMSRIRMRTLSLWEAGLSSGAVGLQELMSGRDAVDGAAPLRLAEVVEAACHGGWPADHRLPWRLAAANVADYCEEIAGADVRTVDGVRRDVAKVRLLMQSLARNTATMARQATLAADVASQDTVGDYVTALRRLMVLEPLTGWSPVLRSKARLRVAAKHHFVDPAMSAALLNAGPDELMRDMKTFGFLFESLVVRDLRVYAQPLGGTVHHYRDSNNLEVDCVIDAGYGRWGAVEVKLAGSADVIDVAAKALTAFAATVDTQSTGEPRFLAVITAEGYAYTRPDGVHVIPLTVLRP